jgi:hypothetical protein
MALKDWKRDWNINPEYPEWNSKKGDLLSIYEGDAEDVCDVSVGSNGGLDKKIAKGVSRKEAMKIAKEYMRAH